MVMLGIVALTVERNLHEGAGVRLFAFAVRFVLLFLMLWSADILPPDILIL